MEFQPTADVAVLFVIHGLTIAVLFLGSLYAIWHLGCIVVSRCIRSALREFNLYRDSVEFKHFVLHTQDEEKREHIQ